MKRGTSGRFETRRVAGEQVRAFVPRKLPPDPAVVLDGALQLLLEQALLGLGRLDSLSTLLPDTSLFLYTYVRKEAVLSSQIEALSHRFLTSSSSNWKAHPACRWGT